MSPEGEEHRCNANPSRGLGGRSSSDGPAATLSRCVCGSRSPVKLLDVTRRFRTLADAYEDGLTRLVHDGTDVPSVRDPTSKASNFGACDRPSRELLCDCFEVEDPRQALLVLPSGVGPAIDAAYAFALLAWTLDGRSDGSILAYYRPGAIDYLDDQFALSGAFGNRLFGLHRTADQLAAITAKLSSDPAARRTVATILSERDNFRESREYPCAVAVQLFVRSDRLFLLTMMRAQQALTVLPYDAFLFMLLQSYCASLLHIEVGSYFHFSGTYHIYANEMALATETVSRGCSAAHATFGPNALEEADTLIRMEQEIRQAAVTKKSGLIRAWSSEPLTGLLAAARDAFIRHATTQ